MKLRLEDITLHHAIQIYSGFVNISKQAAHYSPPIIAAYLYNDSDSSKLAPTTRSVKLQLCKFVLQLHLH